MYTFDENPSDAKETPPRDLLRQYITAFKISPLPELTLRWAPKCAVASELEPWHQARKSIHRW